MSSSSSSSIPHIASTLLLLLLLLLSLKLLINGLNSLSTLFLCLFFKAPPCILLSFLKGLKLPADASLSAFQSLAEALRSILVRIIEMVLGILTSFLMAVLGFVKNVVFGSFAESGWGFGDLLEKTKASWEGSLLEQVREIVGSVCKNIIDKSLGMASSSTGGLFDLAKTGISRLLKEPGLGIGRLVEMSKGGSFMEGVRGIVGNLTEKVGNEVLGVASSSTGGSFEIVKTIFGVVMDSGYTLGGLVEKTRAALEVLRMEELRAIIQSIVYSKTVKDVTELQIGVTGRPSSCDIQAHKGDRIKVHYRGKLTDGTVFDSSFERGDPIEFELGAGQVIKGWDQGLLGMCVGEKRKLKIPAKLGYGPQGSPPTIPGGATLIFDTELVAVNGKPSSSGGNSDNDDSEL